MLKYRQSKLTAAILIALALLSVLSLAQPALGSAPHQIQPLPTSHTFPETGKTVRGRFLQYWQENGTISQFGYPISDELGEVSDSNGYLYTVQYFERALFEYHPENLPPNDIQLALLGSLLYKQRYFQEASNQVPNASTGSVFFPETGKKLGDAFYDYWRKHGGLSLQGFPISDEFTESSVLDNKNYRVQYFERAVYEYHPEKKAPNNVLLSQLGTYWFRTKYPNGSVSPVHE